MKTSQKVRPFLRIAFVSCLAAVLHPACADPEGAYEDFVARQKSLQKDAGSTTQCATFALPAPGDLSGDYLFALSAKLSPYKPIVGIAQISLDTSSGSPTLSFHIQPVDAATRKTPVGAPIIGGPFPLAADGSFTADFGAISVPGEANPISGSPIETTVTLAGPDKTWCKPADFICGTVDGIMSKPLNSKLAGSTFTFQRIVDPNNRPPVVINCSKAPAEVP